MRRKDHFDAMIIGGGLAGLTSAIHLSKAGYMVLLIEKNSYPQHKVCGEYVSNETLPYLRSLGFDPFKLGAQKINKFLLTTPNNKKIEATLPLGGFGISRYTLDAALAQEAINAGAKIVQDTVLEINFFKDEFTVHTKDNKQHFGKLVIGAYGKRTPIDVKLQRRFIKKKSPYLAVKIHARGDFPKDLVALHNFEGGYCGVSKVENDQINICYIADYASFKKYRDISTFQEKVLYKNKYLKSIFENTEMVFSKPLTIGQISFASKSPIENHMLMCGDTAGMIHPLCGNGMGMAIRSAQLASSLIIEYLNGNIETRESLEKSYRIAWNRAFIKRLKVGHMAASLFKMHRFSELLMFGLKGFPSLLPKIIKQTHGKPIIVK